MTTPAQLITYITALLLALTTPAAHAYSSSRSKSTYRPSPRTRSVKLHGGGPIRGDTLPALIRAAEATQRGLDASNNAAIIAMMTELGEKNERFSKTFLDKVNGKWELVWTTEKETLFFIKNGFFGKRVTNVYQTVDIPNNLINNLIEFDGQREFSVLGTAARDPQVATRVNFAFTKAVISVPPLPKLTLPPVGNGWFDNIFVNDKYRLARDVRGDYLITQRVA